MNLPPPLPEHPELPGRAPLPPSPFVLLDTITVEQAAAALSRLEGWLRSADPAATAACAHACSFGEDDAVSVAGWVGTLADRLRSRAEEATSWS
jgi:hypothetical protein